MRENFAARHSRRTSGFRSTANRRAPLPPSAVAPARNRRFVHRVQLPALVRIAQEVVAAAQRRLPAEVRTVAATVPVCYEAVPNDAILAEGWEPDILGLFVGHEHGGELRDDFAPLPPQILLFLENLWDYAEGDAGVYRDEVRLTYLHELGHYLGWDEDEVAERGLE